MTSTPKHSAALRDLAASIFKEKTARDLIKEDVEGEVAEHTPTHAQEPSQPAEPPTE
ncbi:hypothetical protein [Labrenzia sp. OB1]|uniref:hypothetical protein n=1 Tax=Labrenzia sp. OB1 TaxID=1561204 RepID=UPI000B314052|nr:hypothetical protein [Labrenzia sp. OB1]